MGPVLSYEFTQPVSVPSSETLPLQAVLEAVHDPLGVDRAKAGAV
jgi:hypothetical protein